MGDKMLLNPHVDGLFYLKGKRIPHYRKSWPFGQPLVVFAFVSAA